MSTVREVLATKGYDVWTVSPQATVYEALEIMAEKNVGALPVVDDEGHVVGIFSERDYSRKIVLVGRLSKETAVSELMTASVLYVSPERMVDACMALMTDKRVRHLPVMEEDKLVGIVSIGDVVKNIIADQEHTIQDLENYIAGRGYGAG